jgi:hypothetical protein
MQNLRRIVLFLRASAVTPTVVQPEHVTGDQFGNAGSRPGVRADNALDGRVSMTEKIVPTMSIGFTTFLSVIGALWLKIKNSTYLKMFSLSADTDLPQPDGTQ